jgi:hypothetical protein
MALGIPLALYMEDTSIYATEKHEHCVVSKLHHGHTAVKSWCDHWNMKINEGKTQAIYIYRRFRVPEDELQLNGQNISFVKNVKYLVAIFNRRMFLDMYIRTYSLLKSEHLSANVKHTPYRVLIRSVMIYACPTWEYAVNTHLLKLQCLQNRVLCTIGNLGRRTQVFNLHVAFKMPCTYD